MLPVSAMSFAVLALSAQYLAPAAALSGDALQTYTEWKQTSYYTEAVKVAVTYGAVSGSYSSSTKTGVSNSTASSGSLASNVTITSSSSSSSSTDVAISETEEQERFDQALAAIAELQELHPHANFSVNTPFVLLTSDEFLAYVNRYAVDPSSSAFQASSSSKASGDGGPLTTDAQSSNSSVASSEDGGPMTSSAASGETVDWEDAGCVTAVKDQGECGACWAFSATAAMESGYCVASGGSLPSLADQELISCDVDGDNNGCGGGYAAYTIDWIANDRSGKMCTLDTYPFASDDGDVPSCAMSSCTEVDIGVTGYKSLREDPGALEDAVRSHPVSVFLYSGSNAFQYYSSGVLTGENCDKTGSHSALAVGFGETDEGVLYWRIKNQWGTDWGEEGYVRVQRRYSGDSDGACGVEMYATWPTFDVTSTSSSASSSVDTTSTPSVTTATSTTAPSTTAPSTTTATPSVTTKTPTTAAPSATKGAVVSNSATNSPSATEAAQSQAADQTVSSKSSSEDVTIYTIEAPTATPAATVQADAESVAGEASYSTTTTPAATAQADAAQNDQSASVAGEAAYSTTPSPSHRDCAM